MGDVSHVSKLAIQEVRDEVQDQRDRQIEQAELAMQVAADHIDAIFFTARRKYRVRSISIVQATAGTDAGAQGAQIRKLTGTQGADAGAALLAAGYNMKTAVANTVNELALTATAADLELAVGDRLAFSRDEAPTTGLTNSVVSVGLIPV